MRTGNRELHFNAFFQASPSQSWPGLWSHPKSTSQDYTKIQFWTDLARRAESGLIDCIFFADGLGIMSAYGGSEDEAIKTGAFFPANDPMMLIPAMTAVTNHLCFGVTGTTTVEAPYLLARRFSTLDHITDGRLAWNIVTGAVPSAAKALGISMPEHDKRYDQADEFMDLVYKLWEGSWEDGAALKNKKTGVFTDPTRIHRISHKSEHYSCDAIHMVEPSPQRTPLIFSAGASPRGIEFAGRHAECVFMSTNNKGFARKVGASMRDAAERAGRSRESLKVFNAATIVVAPTEAQAHDLVAEYQRYSSPTGNLVVFSGWLNTDLSRYAPDDPVEVIESNAIQSIADSMRASRGEGAKITLADLAKFADVGGREAFIVGSPEQVCDELARWRDEGDVDGFNLVRTVEPYGLQSFIDLVVPELQTRGMYKTKYAQGSMREQLFPGSAGRLPSSHYGSRFKVG
jgi:long-chain alkane monooxygenase